MGVKRRRLETTRHRNISNICDRPETDSYRAVNPLRRGHSTFDMSGPRPTQPDVVRLMERLGRHVASCLRLNSPSRPEMRLRYTSAPGDSSESAGAALRKNAARRG
jgi:hypothetical protein